MADVSEADRKKRREALVILFLLLCDDTYESLSHSVSEYLTGSASIHSTARVFTSTLFGAHVQATYYGRRLAGVIAPMGESDQYLAQTVMAGQASFVTRLLNELNTTRYPLGSDGELPPDLLQRLRLWARRLRGTANDAWRLALDPETLLWWVLDPTLQHCETCPVYAASSPRRAADWDVQPGSADCECGSNCGCEFRDEDGNFGFPRDGRE